MPFRLRPRAGRLLLVSAARRRLLRLRPHGPQGLLHRRRHGRGGRPPPRGRGAPRSDGDLRQPDRLARRSRRRPDGLGFLLGGFCPGTSVCAAAIGKVDAIVFLAGGALGVFGYAELFPRFAAFADSTSLGPAKIYESLGVTPGLFVLLLAAAAILAFAVGGIVERKVAPDAAPSRLFATKNHVAAAAVLLAFAALAAVLPNRNARLVAKVNAPGYVPHHVVKPMTPDELAFRILDRAPRLRVVDLRPEAARKA
ncbi:MAG: YeeE/YedE family protein, partial [Holophagales bacterium]|nr:YeeE/YedE family protein [Holophagales bacterium]